MERFLRGNRGRGPRTRGGRGRGRIEPESDEFLSLEEEANFIRAGFDGSDSSEEESGGGNSEESESEGIPDSAFIGAKEVVRKVPPWCSKFYEKLVYPPDSAKLSAKSIAAQCKICVIEGRSHTYQSATIGSLTNLSRHVKRQHKEEWEEYEKTVKPAVKQSEPQVSSSSTTPFSKARQEEVERALATMIVIDNMPVTSTLKPGFRHFIKVFFQFIFLKVHKDIPN